MVIRNFEGWAIPHVVGAVGLPQLLGFGGVDALTCFKWWYRMVKHIVVIIAVGVLLVVLLVVVLLALVYNILNI